MVRAYLISITHDWLGVAVFFENMVGKMPKLREMYQPYQCKKCKKVNLTAISNVGFPASLKLNHIRLDYFETDDGFHIVSSSFAEYLRGIVGEAVSFSPIHETGYLHMQCRDHIAPPVDCRLYTPVEPADPNDVFQVRGRRCQRCGRFKVVTYQPEAYPYPNDIFLFSFDIDQPFYLAFSIVCSPNIGEEISKKKFSGLRLLPVRARGK